MITGKSSQITINPASVLARVRADAAMNGLAQKLIAPTQDIGTPDAKIRLGWVDTVDYTAWTCNAYVGDQGTLLPNLPMMANARPVAQTMGVFTQVGNEYILLGLLQRDNVGGPAQGGADFRIYKPNSTGRASTTTPTADPELVFWGQAGRKYIVQAVLLVTNSISNTSNDFQWGVSVPSGSSWSGGGLNPDVSVTAMTGLVGWQGTFGAVGVTFAVGLGPGINVVNRIQLDLSVAIGATSGPVAITWSQFSSSPTVTTVRSGSWLKADVCN